MDPTSQVQGTAANGESEHCVHTHAHSAPLLSEPRHLSPPEHSQVGLGADTKMLRAGWGSWGGSCDEATISSEMMADEAWAGRSGEGFVTQKEVRLPIRR